LRGEIFLAVVDLSQNTFFSYNCKIADPFVVKSFAKLYFARKRPFHLPRQKRVISFALPDGEAGSAAE
jgi:hypothetical protein